MRKVLAVSLIAILIVNLFGYFISFTAQRYRIRMEAKIEKRRNAREFAFSPAEFEKLHTCEGGKEFSLNGGMYDVVKKELRGGKIILTAYFDHKETGLIQNFLSYFKDETSSSKSKRHRIPSFNLFEFVAAATPFEWYVPTQKFTFLSYSSPLIPAVLEISSPPPDLLKA